MFSIMKRPVIFGAMLMSAVMALAQRSREKRSRCKATKGRRQSFETRDVCSWMCRTWRESQKAL